MRTGKSIFKGRQERCTGIVEKANRCSTIIRYNQYRFIRCIIRIIPDGHKEKVYKLNVLNKMLMWQIAREFFAGAFCVEPAEKGNCKTRGDVRVFRSVRPFFH